MKVSTFSKKNSFRENYTRKYGKLFLVKRFKGQLYSTEIVKGFISKKRMSNHYPDLLKEKMLRIRQLFLGDLSRSENFLRVNHL